VIKILPVAGTFDIDIVVSLMPKVNITLNLLQKIRNTYTAFIVSEVEF